jgi:hypothetical protein
VSAVRVWYSTGQYAPRPDRVRWVRGVWLAGLGGRGDVSPEATETPAWLGERRVLQCAPDEVGPLLLRRVRESVCADYGDRSAGCVCVDGGVLGRVTNRALTGLRPRAF